jgi:hypothetical protein
MSLSKNKVFIILPVVTLLIIAAVAGYKIFSIYSFNSLAKELHSENKNLFTSFKDEAVTENKLNENLLKALDPQSDASTTSKYLGIVETDYERSLKNYKKGVDELKSKSNDITRVDDIPLWLTSDQKKFVNDIAAAVKQYSEAREADYQHEVKTKPVTTNLLQILSDTNAFASYLAKIGNPASAEAFVKAYGDNLSEISSLEKYTKEDYEFEGKDSLSTEFPSSYKTFDLAKDSFAVLYLSSKAISQGDLSLSQLATFSSGVEKLGMVAVSFDDMFVEIAQKQRPFIVKIKDAYISYAKVLDFFANKKLHSNLLSKEKVLTQNNQNKLVVFAYRVELYYIDKGSYPTDATFSSLVTTLKSGNHFNNDLKYDESDFTYASDGASYYELGFKDEVSGKEETVLFGLKEDSEQSLGVTTYTPTIKVKGKEVKLEPVSRVTNSLESFVPLGLF